MEGVMGLKALYIPSHHPIILCQPVLPPDQSHPTPLLLPNLVNFIEMLFWDSTNSVLA